MADILKQNVGNKIIRQIQPPYKILKANYNFGKGFRTISTSIYLNIDFAELAADSYTFEYFLKIFSTNTDGVFHSVRHDNNTRYADASYFQNANRYPNGEVGSNAAGYITQSNPGVNRYEQQAILADLRGGSTTAYRNGSLIGSGNMPIANTITRWRSGYGFVNANQFTVNQGNSMYGFMRVYTRLLSVNELRHSYNKGIGNEPINTLSQVGEYEFSKAEILDFSITQDNSDLRVGVRNLILPSYNIEIIGLPAGTLEQKRDYANANLFVNFL